jgi:hypothetical protein
VTFYLAQQYARLNNREPGQGFKGIEGSGVSKASARVMEKMGSD